MKFNFAINYKVFLEIFGAVILILGFLVLFVPFTPEMPQPGLDHSWAYGMNVAINDGLLIGKDILFTFGPYASIVTKLYHPATDSLMIYGGLYLGLNYSIVLLLLARNVSTIWILLLYIVLAGFVYFLDPILISYPLLLALIFYRMALPENDKYAIRVTKNQEIAISILFAPMGLLCLIKGSLLIICIVISVISFAFLRIKKKTELSLLIVIVPIFSALAFWLLSGHHFSGISSYVSNLLPVISGYTNAMSIDGDISEIFLYMAASTGLLYVIATTDEVSSSSKAFLFLCYAFVLFIMFKGGFVRHDGHAVMAGVGVLIAAILLSFAVKHRYLPFAILVSTAAWGYIDQEYFATSTKSTFDNVYNSVSMANKGLRTKLRDSGSYIEEFNKANDKIRAEYSIPALEGTTDIYSYNQSYLFASDNKWNPRPVFQSYSVFTAYLAGVNRDHLIGESAPDNILFSVEPVDNRYPSLEDGLSWPALLNNYYPVKLDTKFVYLKKLEKSNILPVLDEVVAKEYRMEDVILLPETSSVLFARIDIRPTMFGRIAGLLYKSQHLELTIETHSGKTKKYRLISSMASSGFVISPLVEDTRDFSILFGKGNYLHDKMVKSIKVTVVGEDAYHWNRAITVSISKVAMGPAYDIHNWIRFDEINGALPTDFQQRTSDKCLGHVDKVNGYFDGSAITNMSRILSVDGWLAESVEESLAPEVVFITLTDADGMKKYIKAKTLPRPDVRQYYSQPLLPDVGYQVYTDLTGLSGKYTLGISKLYEGTIVSCENFNLPITIVK